MKKIIVFLFISCVFAFCDKGGENNLPVCGTSLTCTVTDTQCQGDSLIFTCDSGYSCISNCPQICQDAGQNYSGVCDVQYQGQFSPTGDDVCWCLAPPPTGIVADCSCNWTCKIAWASDESGTNDPGDQCTADQVVLAEDLSAQCRQYMASHGSYTSGSQCDDGIECQCSCTNTGISCDL
jgi:hypothetical protein